MSISSGNQDFGALSHLQARAEFLVFTSPGTSLTCGVVHWGAGWVRAGATCVQT